MWSKTKLQDKTTTAPITRGGSTHLIPYVLALLSVTTTHSSMLFSYVNSSPYFAVKTHKTKFRILSNHTQNKILFKSTSFLSFFFLTFSPFNHGFYDFKLWLTKNGWLHPFNRSNVWALLFRTNWHHHIPTSLTILL